MPKKEKVSNAAKKPQNKANSQPKKVRVKSFFVNKWQAIKQRVNDLLKRRPHRSFKKTLRRDYIRSLKLPGYWAFTNYVRKTLWAHKKLFLFLILLYGALTALMVGIASQDTYAEVSETLRTYTGDIFQGNVGALGEAGVLLATNLTGAYNSTPTEAQQIYGAILLLFTWLTTVWILRTVMAGGKPKLRDAIYNAGAPILPTLLIYLVGVLQLLPVALAAMAFSAGFLTGILETGVEAMLFWIVAVLLIMLSLYWMTSTLIAAVVVTLPGMYPMQALKVGGDLVVGRRVRILLRVLWLLLLVAFAWIIIMIPMIVFDTWLKSVVPAVQWLPLVPVALLGMSTLSVIWVASYVYLLYRKVVDDDAAPA